jgi:small subunit ribosomal protein S2
MIDYPIPANDDATKTINLILHYVQQAIEQGKSKRVKSEAKDKPAEDETPKKVDKVVKEEKKEVDQPVKGIG